jgi:hypothetical protein
MKGDSSCCIPQLTQISDFSFGTGIQGMHSTLGHDARADLAVLSAIELQNRTLAQIAEGGMPATGRAELRGRGTSNGSGLRGLLPSGAVAQCEPLRRAARSAGRPGRGDLDREGSEAGGGPVATAASASGSFTGSLASTPGDDGRSAGGRIKLRRPGETEASHAGEPPCRGITR